MRKPPTERSAQMSVFKRREGWSRSRSSRRSREVNVASKRTSALGHHFWSQCLSRKQAPAEAISSTVLHKSNCSSEHALQKHILHYHELPHSGRLQRLGWWRPGETIVRPLTHEEIVHTSRCRLTQPLHSLKTSPAAARRNAAKSAPSCATGSSTCPSSRGQSGDACARSRASALGCPTGSKGTLPTAGNGARHEQHHRESLLSRTDMRRLSDHIMRVIDVLCLSAVTIRERLGAWMARRRVTRRYKKPAKCMKKLRSLEQQHANTHRLFVKQCCLMDQHAVNADRLKLVHQIGWGRRGVKQAQLQGNTREATTFTVAFSMDRGPLDMLVQIVHANKASGQSIFMTLRQRTAGPPRGRSCSSRPPGTTGWTRASKDKRRSSSVTWPASTAARPPWPPW